MPNVWDGLSALILKNAGFAASAAEHLAHAKLLIDVSGLPVNGDFEDGYGATPEDVAATVLAAIDTGLAGIGVEDTRQTWRRSKRS
jgi:2-methylisocitrate lyase-like PEP mutase family enzyme